MTRKECVDGMQRIIDEDRNKILVRVNVGGTVTARMLPMEEHRYVDKDGHTIIEYRMKEDTYNWLVSEMFKSCQRIQLK